MELFSFRPFLYAGLAVSLAFLLLVIQPVVFAQDPTDDNNVGLADPTPSPTFADRGCGLSVVFIDRFRDADYSNDEGVRLLSAIFNEAIDPSEEAQLAIGRMRRGLQVEDLTGFFQEVSALERACGA